MIISTTLAGPGASDIIADALRSAEGLVGRYLVIDGGGGPDALRAARETVGADRLAIGSYGWRGDYGHARTWALEHARELGATWALTLDTDERLAFVAPTDKLADPGVDVISVADRDVDYHKPRYIRCRPGITWEGRAHELLRGERKPHSIAPGHFWELPKSDNSRRLVWERFVAWVAEQPLVLETLAWRRHYADCLLGLGERERAAEQFALVSEAPDAIDDERAWSHYRICELDLVAENVDRAFMRASQALAAYPRRIQEFGYILAHCHRMRGRFQEACLWAEYALAAPMQVCGGQRSASWRSGCEQILAVHQEACGA